MSLGDLSISKKMFGVIGLLASVAVGIGGTAYYGLSTLSQAAWQIDQTSIEIKDSVALNENLVRLNRAEYWIAANPSDYDAVVADTANVERLLKEHLAKINATAGENQKRMLNQIQTALDAYMKGLAGTMALARKVKGSVDVDQRQLELLDSVESSRDEARKARDAIENYVNYTDAKGTRLSQEASASARNMTVLIFAVAGIGILAGLALGWVVASKGMVNPIRSIVACLRTLAEGNLEIDVFGVERRDEVGDIAKATLVFQENMRKNQEMAEQQQREQEAQSARAKRIEDLCMAFDTSSSEAVRSVAAAAGQMESSSESMSATAEETTRQASAVAAASEQASANVQTVASAAEELSGSIAEIGRQVTQASNIASEATHEAKATNTKIQGLAEAANKIGEVLALITDIADQTNLLALNATIEAARAGDAGKGFAVVASEVKNLANQTAKATDEIGTQIAGIQTATREAVSAIESITRIISEINEVNSGVASAVEEQSAATQEIARNVEQAATGTREVSSNITGVNQAANDTGAAATQIHSAAGELSQQAERLRSDVAKFLTDVRAA